MKHLLNLVKTILIVCLAVGCSSSKDDPTVVGSLKQGSIEWDLIDPIKAEINKEEASPIGLHTYSLIFFNDNFTIDSKILIPDSTKLNAESFHYTYDENETNYEFIDLGNDYCVVRIKGIIETNTFSIEGREGFLRFHNDEFDLEFDLTHFFIN